MLRHAAPGFDELGIEVRLVLQVGTVGAEEGLQRFGGKFARRSIVRVTVRHGSAQPLVVDEIAHWLGMAHRLFKLLNVRGQVGRRGHAQGHHANALFGSEMIGRGL